MIRYLKKQSYDIIALQETYINNDEIKKFEREMGFIYHHTSGIGRSRGLITAFSRKVESNVIKLIFKTDRMIISEFQLKNKRIFIVNIYAPCADEEKILFFNQLKLVIEDKIPLEERANIICLGDFNTVRDNSLDIISGTMHSKRTIAAFNDFIEWFDFNDIWREQNPKIKDYTWCRPDMTSARRLDYILTGLNLCLPEYRMNTHFHTIALTDHRAVVLSLNTEETARGNSIFKIDNRLLNDINYVNIIKKTISDTVDNNIDLDPQLKWEMVKIKIREISEQYNITFRRQQQIITKKNEKRLKYLENELINDPNNNNITRDICKLKKEIELKLIADTRAAATRAGVKWIEQGEKAMHIF